MATRTIINSNLTVLQSVLESSGYFDEVVNTTTHAIGTSQYTGLECSTSEHQGVLFIGYQNTNTARWGWHAKSPSIPSVWYDPVYAQSNAFPPTAAVQCTGGLLILGSTGSLLITKNNRDKVLIAAGHASGSIKSTVMSELFVVAEDDSASSNMLSYKPAVYNQTLLIPLVSCAGVDVTSYTTTAYIYSTRQYEITGHIQYNGKRYFTDGYFAVEDEEDAS